jgi:hypothetical protein
MLDFIEVYPQALSVADCTRIIEQFEASGQAQRGKTGGGVDVTLKDSYDITISNKPEWRPVVGLLQRAVFHHLKDYIRKYRFCLIGPLALRLQSPGSSETILINDQTFDSLSDEDFTKMLLVAFRCGSINLQKYLAGQGGYPHWHSELYPRDQACETLHRVLLFTFYLNPVPEAGETEFFYQQRKIRPETGSLLIAPAGFTHTHRGNTPQGGDKYIATSWILFSRTEQLYGSK